MSDAQPQQRAVPLPQLRRACPTEELGFRTTADLGADGPESDRMDGVSLQERALAALALGVDIPFPGHNVYVMGIPGSGRHAGVHGYLQRAAAGRTPPDDWCYLNRFDDPQRPRAVRLPRGRGSVLKSDLRELMQDLRTALPQALESEAHRNRRNLLEREFEQRARESLDAVRREAEAGELVLVQTPDGLGVAPAKHGEILPREEFDKLPESKRLTLSQRMDSITEKVRAHFDSVPRWARDHQHRLRELDRDAIAAIVRVHIAELRARYADSAAVLEHLTNMESDIVENAAGSIRAVENPMAIPGLEKLAAESNLARYEVNVFIDSRANTGAPVVYESNPTYRNLIGQIENIAQLGILRTDFTLVRPGALHRANGGFLILDAERVLARPFAWEALKHSLFERCVRIEPLGAHLALINTVSLEPDRIPIRLRVVLIGSRRLYDLLCEYDPEFPELFKVAADFEDTIERNAENTRRYVHLIAQTVRREALKPFDATAVARLIEHSARLAGDSAKLSMHLRSLQDAVREAHHFAAVASEASVRATDVRHALEEQRRRLARAQEQAFDAIRRHILLIDCDGEAVGQINGLSVVRIGQLYFGQPARITASVRIGAGDVIDIEREVKLGGALHSKGVLILAALIGERFGTRRPLSLHASLVFEQSYGDVEGDSASLAEACALLSAIARIPLRQSLGVTGSINQRGIVQAIGSVNEKIEGFFEACRLHRLTGSQGVIIPTDNVPHLMLNDAVIDAVEHGRFHLYSVGTLDEAIELLSGRTAGEFRDPDGYPGGSFNAGVDERLRQFARARQEFTRESLTGATLERPPPASTPAGDPGIRSDPNVMDEGFPRSS